MLFSQTINVANTRDPSQRLPDPPRFDLWPATVQSAMLLRGSLVRCGPGVRGIAWPDSPRVRLVTLAPWLRTRAYVCHMTAAWVWGAARTHRTAPLHIAARAGWHHRPGMRDGSVIRHELRLADTDIVMIGEHGVTSPARTVCDLLHEPKQFGVPERVACRLLTLMTPGGSEAMLALLRSRRTPGKRLALERFQHDVLR